MKSDIDGSLCLLDTVGAYFVRVVDTGEDTVESNKVQMLVQIFSGIYHNKKGFYLRQYCHTAPQLYVACGFKFSSSLSSRASGSVASSAAFSSCICRSCIFHTFDASLDLQVHAPASP